MEFHSFLIFSLSTSVFVSRFPQFSSCPVHCIEMKLKGLLHYFYWYFYCFVHTSFLLSIHLLAVSVHFIIVIPSLKEKDWKKEKRILIPMCLLLFLFFSIHTTKFCKYPIISSDLIFPLSFCRFFFIELYTFFLYFLLSWSSYSRHLSTKKLRKRFFIRACLILMRNEEEGIVLFYEILMVSNGLS